MTLMPRTASQFMSAARRVLRHAEVDSAVIFGVLSTIRGAVSGPVAALLIAFYFTPELQGYYYAFISLLALQVFVELGLGYVIVQFASHEWSSLSLDEHHRITGSPEALSRLISLGRVAFRWYAIAGGILAVGLGVAGYVFFSQSPYPGIDWLTPWLVLCVLTGLWLCLVPLWSLLEGCNQVSQVYAFRVTEGILVTLTTCLAIVFGAGLWVPAMATAVALAWSMAFLRRRYWPFFLVFFAPPKGPSIHWWSEIWSMQWRIALSWLSGYFVFSLFTPVLFHYHGAVAAGQMGMTWSLVSGLLGVSSMWAITKAPRFGVLIAKKEYATLDRLFFRVTVASVVVTSCGAIAIWTTVYLLYAFGHSLSARLLPPLPTGLFLAATVLMQISIPMSVYLRAHKTEPLLGLSVVSGILIGLLTWFLGRRFGAIGMAVGYLSVVALGLPMATVIWYRCRAAWHAPISGQRTVAGVVEIQKS